MIEDETVHQGLRCETRWKRPSVSIPKLRVDAEIAKHLRQLNCCSGTVEVISMECNRVNAKSEGE